MNMLLFQNNHHSSFDHFTRYLFKDFEYSENKLVIKLFTMLYSEYF